MKLKDLKNFKLPDKPGVYFFLKTSLLTPLQSTGEGKGSFSGTPEKAGDEVLYIGKATSLRDRTKSYFNKDIIVSRGPMILDMVVQADKIDWQATDSVLEALILESELIKKHQPKYNVKEKDDKSWNYVCITKDELPKILIVRGKNLNKKEFKSSYGPFTSGLQLKEALKIIRKIFPFLDDKSKNNYEFYRQLKLVPENEDYRKNIRNIKLFFEGKKKKILSNLKKEMKILARKHEFEKAGETKRQINALQHIQDISLIKNDFLEPRTYKLEPNKIEAYDIAHLSGKNMVGVMTVVENNEVQKSEYKKFIIRTQLNSNDTGALEEVLLRRFRHTEWGIPGLVVVDGSIAQINVAKRVLLKYQIKIPIVGVVKDERHKAKAIAGDENIIQKYKKQILLANAEAHRFAITFYRQKSRKNMLK